jgi:hypothetical protein
VYFVAFDGGHFRGCGREGLCEFTVWKLFMIEFVSVYNGEDLYIPHLMPEKSCSRKTFVPIKSDISEILHHRRRIIQARKVSAEIMIYNTSQSSSIRTYFRIAEFEHSLL